MIGRRMVLASLLALSAAPAAGHPHGQLDAERIGDIERQLAAFRGALKDAAAAKDAVKLRTLYAEGYVHTHGSGTMDGRDARIVSLLAGDPVIETAPVTELSIRVHGPDTAIVTGRSPILNARENRTYEFRWMQVYTRASGDWQLAASQATRLPATT